MLIRVACAALLIAAMAVSQSGYPRSRGSNGSIGTRDYGGPAVTFHGKLKQITKRDIVIETDEDQALSIGRSHKTKFLKNDRPVKPADIPTGAALTIDVVKDPDLKPLAVNVFVDVPPSKPATR